MTKREQKQKTVLLVEDEDSVREFLSMTLKENNFNVLEAVNGENAIMIYNEQRKNIDVIVSDLRMSNVDGIQFAKYNFAAQCLPFVVCTAVSDGDLAMKLLSCGVKDYVVKPVKEKELVAVVRKAALRRETMEYNGDDGNLYPGNVDEITIPSEMAELPKAANWVKNKIETVLTEQESRKFVNFLNEFLINAHEHGNMKISGEEKNELISQNCFHETIELRELKVNAKIDIVISILKDHIAVKITDEGEGFDYEKYLSMSKNDIVDTFNNPSGRGIAMATNYFDRIKYGKEGASVILTKKYQCH